MTFPTVLLETNFDVGPWTTPTWVDITGRFRRASIDRGRGGELDSFREGRATFVVDNRDRYFEPERGLIPHAYPNRRIRLSGDGTVVFDGYIDSVRPRYVIGPSGGGDAFVEIDCTDATKFLARAPLVSPLAYEIGLDGPASWWRFADPPASTTALDSGDYNPTPAEASAELVKFGAQPIVPGSRLTAATIASTDDGLLTPIIFPELDLPFGITGWTWEMVLLRPPTLENSTTLFSASGDYDPVVGPSTPSLIVFLTPIGPTADSGVFITASARAANGSSASFGKHRIDTPVAHLAVRVDGTDVDLFVNGVLVESDTTTAMVTNLRRGFMGGTSSDNYGFEFTAAEVAMHDTALSDARILAHGQATTQPWLGDSTDERLDRICDLVGIPAGFRDFGTGATTGLSAVVEPLDDVKAIVHARLVEATEQGRLFVSADGLITMTERTATLNTASAVTFGDGAGEVPYSELIGEYGEGHIVNEATITRQGGTPQRVSEAASITQFGTLGLQRDVLYGTDAEAVDAAHYVVGRNGFPHFRFEALTVHAHRSTATAVQCTQRELGDKVTVKRRPPGGGTITKDVVIEGISHDLNASTRTWTTTYTLSPADTGTYWQLGRAGYSELDTTTRLSF